MRRRWFDRSDAHLVTFEKRLQTGTAKSELVQQFRLKLLRRVVDTMFVTMGVSEELRTDHVLEPVHDLQVVV